MATYEQLYFHLVQDINGNRLWRQTYVAILIAAADIRSEDPATANHANRLIWAAAAEADTAAKVLAMRHKILQKATLAAAPYTPTDSDVQFVVNSLIDTFATGSYVVLMDARMPIMDGLEATRRIKKRWPEVKVIVLTVYAAYRSAAQAAGADAFVIKGAPPEELLEAILDPQEEEDDVQQSIPGATTGA